MVLWCRCKPCYPFVHPTEIKCLKLAFSTRGPSWVLPLLACLQARAIPTPLEVQRAQSDFVSIFLNFILLSNIALCFWGKGGEILNPQFLVCHVLVLASGKAMDQLALKWPLLIPAPWYPCP